MVLPRFLLHESILSAGGSLETFTDGGLTSAWAADALRRAVGAGIINGMGDGTVAPQGSATRAQIAAILQRFLTR